MKKFLFILACALAIVSCGQKNNVNVNDNDNTPRSTLHAQHSTLNKRRRAEGTGRAHQPH